MGRPRLLTDTKFEEVITLLQAGCRLGEALVYVGVSRKVFHDTVKNTPLYRDKYRSAKKFLKVSTKKIVAAAILKGDVQTAKWYLEKTDEDFMPKQKNINENKDTDETISSLRDVINTISTKLKSEVQSGD